MSEDAELLSLLRSGLEAAGFAPREARYDDVFRMAPFFGPSSLVVFIVYTGSDPERMHVLANHLSREWSEEGRLVLYIVFHPDTPREEDVFKMWTLDGFWEYDSPGGS